MSHFIDSARGAVEQAELYWLREREISVRYENSRLQQIVENDLSSVSVRVIHEGRLGTTFGVSPDAPGLLDEAKQAASYGPPATHGFAPVGKVPTVRHEDPAAAALQSANLVALCEDVRAEIGRRRPEIALSIGASSTTRQRTVETTEGVLAEDRSTQILLHFGAPIRGAGVSVSKATGSTKPLESPSDLIEEFDEWYGWTAEASTPLTGRMPAIFAPEAAFLYLLPLWAGLAGGAIVKGTSPLVGRIGERILSQRLTIHDDPLRPEDPCSRPFDDEGVSCRRRALVDHGVLSGYLLDRATAQALGTSSTGNAVKRELFGRGTETPANPWPIQFVVEPGALSIREMIAGLDEGLLITGGLGFHSGNYPQGQFAVQAIGFHIRRGRVVGRLDGTMISADIYDDFSNVRSISSEQRPGYTGLLGGGIAPYVLVDSIQVAGR